MKIIAVSIQRGGTAKTTTCLALAQAAVKDGKKVLLIDLDPQGNSSFSLKANINAGNSYELLNGAAANRSIQDTESGINIIPASWNLSTVTSKTGSAKRLQDAIKRIKTQYDIVLIDTPPTAGELQYNALQAATGVIIPLQADIYGLQGLYQISEAAEAFKKSNHTLSVIGVIITRYSGRSTLAKQMRQTIEEKAAELNIPYLGEIREGIAIQEAQALQLNLFDYAGRSKPAIDYLNLYKKIMEV